MSRHVDEAQPYAKLDAKTRRKLLDQRRMSYRRAIESYAEQRLLQQELSDYPELIAANYLAAAQALEPRSARPGR
ncbi:PA3496 family putative envelope integrity protein [Pseudomonas sp. MBLB4123]|uniref:Transcriptional regulator n=1 Tax=Pseudomonas benzenivorans TaxID=556533 RepID=A0ABZ0PWE6_9PSED|nr:transcriptional regulator [Pseudomonas benzenivorans]WPC05209.1 transcriptional regulator [Pseudomonas benzenivorans]